MGKQDTTEKQLVQGALGIRLVGLQPATVIFAMSQNITDPLIQVHACKAVIELADIPSQVVDIIAAGGMNAVVNAYEVHKLRMHLDADHSSPTNAEDDVTFHGASRLSAAEAARGFAASDSQR